MKYDTLVASAIEVVNQVFLGGLNSEDVQAEMERMRLAILPPER